MLDYGVPEILILASQLNAEWVDGPDFEIAVGVRLTPDSDKTVANFEHRDRERFGLKAHDEHGDFDTRSDGGWGQLLADFQRATEA